MVHKIQPYVTKKKMIKRPGIRMYNKYYIPSLQKKRVDLRH